MNHDTGSTNGRSPLAQSNKSKLQERNRVIQKTVVHWTVPSVLSIFTIIALVDSCWQNWLLWGGFLLTGATLFYSLQLTSRGKPKTSVLVSASSLIAFATLVMMLHQGMTPAAVSMAMVIIVYSSLFSKRFVTYTSIGFFSGLALSSLVKHMNLYEIKALPPPIELAVDLSMVTLALIVILIMLHGSRTVETNLIRSMDRINDGQKQIIETARNTANILDSAVKQISEAAVEFAEKASDQAEAITDINNAIDVVRSIAGKTAATSSQAGSLAADIQERSSVGQHQLRGMESGFTEIMKINKVAQREFMDLANQAENIEEALRNNRDVAAQIKILAINAGLQGAKADEYGSGFRTVAQNLKSMIARTDDTLKHSRNLLENILMRAKQSEENIERSSILLEVQFQELQSTATLIAAIADAFTVTSQEVTRITQTATDQQIQLDEAASGVNHIDFTAKELKTATRSLLDTVDMITSSQNTLKNLFHY